MVFEARKPERISTGELAEEDRNRLAHGSRRLLRAAPGQLSRRFDPMCGVRPIPASMMPEEYSSG